MNSEIEICIPFKQFPSLNEFSNIGTNYCYPLEIFEEDYKSLSEFICPINKGVLHDPYKDGNNHNFCWSCSLTYLRNDSAKCPVGGEIIKLELLVPNLSLKEKINQQQVKCPKFRNGCTWKGKVIMLESHIRGCKQFVAGNTEICNITFQCEEKKNSQEVCQPISEDNGLALSNSVVRIFCFDSVI